MTATIDAARCIGCKICSLICPEVFVMDGYKVKVLLDPVPKYLESICISLRDQCPQNALLISG